MKSGAFDIDVWIAFFFACNKDRFADDRATPPLDTQQDWILTGAEEQNGFTTLEFTRKLLTCDERDLEIKVRQFYASSYVKKVNCMLKMHLSIGTYSQCLHINYYYL